MNKSRWLYALVAANVLLAFASAGAEGFFGWTLPPSLAEYGRVRFTHFPGPGESMRLFLLATTVLCAFGAWTGLVTHWRHARRLYVASLALSVLLTLVSGPSVRTSVGAMFAELDALVAGAILGLVYFSDLARRFEAGSVPEAAAQMSLGTDRA